ncbi:hypothetical protein ACWGJ6_02395 [Streptomyces canus]
MSEKPKTRKATAAERLAARALGKPEPDEVEVETRSAGEQHYARLLKRQRAAGGDASSGWDGWGEGDDSPPAA